LIDHIQGLEWKNEPLFVEFSANEKVQYDYCVFCTENALLFLSRVSILLLTRDIDIAILSVRLSVCP